MLINSLLMNYTPIHSTYLQEIRDTQNSFIFQQNPSWRTTLFSIKKLGITPYKYQHLLWKHFHKDQRIIVCKSRQIGISTAIDIFCLEAATENLYPSGLLKNTTTVKSETVIIISRNSIPTYPCTMMLLKFFSFMSIS